MAEELKPCHACGHKAIRGMAGDAARCGNADCFMRHDWIAIDNWNTRPERHVLGVGRVGMKPRWGVVLVDDMDLAVVLDWPDNLAVRYRLVLEKETTDAE